jgi:hypothetical protein
MSKTLERLRGRIAATQAEIDGTDTTEMSQAEMRTRLAAYAGGLEQDGLRIIGRRLQESARTGALAALLVNVGADPGPVFAALLGADALVARLAPALAAVPDCPPRADRIARVTQLRAELLALEIEEEQTICAAESRGEPVQRRADADPAAVLWMPEPTAP